MTWPIKKIGEICTLKTGATPSTSHPEYYDGDIKWLVSGNIHQKEIFNCEKRITKLGTENSNAKILPKNCVLIALNGQRKTRGTVAILRVEATCNQSLVAIIPNDEVLPEFLYYNLNARYSDIRNLTGANDRRGLNMKIIRNLEIPVPPIEEQKKIVEKIERFFTKIHEANQLRTESFALSEALLPSALHHIFSSLKTKWGINKIGEVCEKPQYGYTASAKREGIGPKFLRITDIQNNHVDWENVPYCECKNAEKYELKSGDLVFARTGATVGKSFLIESSPHEKSVFASYLIRLRAKEKLLPKYLYAFFQSPDYWEQISSHQVGAAQPNVNASKLSSISITVPSLQEQEKIVVHLDSIFKKVRELQKFQSQTQATFSALKESALKQAMDGKL